MIARSPIPTVHLLPLFQSSTTVLLVLCVSALLLIGIPSHLQAQRTTTKVLPTLFAIQFGTTPPVQILRYEGGEPVSTGVVARTPLRGFPTSNQARSCFETSCSIISRFLEPV